MPTDKEGEGWLLYLTVNEFLTFFAKDKEKDLRNYYLLVIGREIVADDQRHTSYNAVQGISRYDNVEFIPSVIPRAAAMEYLGTEQYNAFARTYEISLNSTSAFTDLVCIVDMVVNENLKVILLHHVLDQRLGWIRHLIDFIEDKFDIKCYGGADIVDDTDTNDYGDKEKIKKTLEMYKEKLSGSDTASDFFNAYTDSLEGTYREILSRRSVEELAEFAKSKGIWVNKKRPKDDIIDKIIENTYRGGV